MLSPGKLYLSLDPAANDRGWAPIRSQDNLTSWGRMNYESKFLMAQNSGYCLDFINEVEQRNNTTLQCPQLVREGNYFRNSKPISST